MTATTTALAASPILVPTCGCGSGPVARFTADAEGTPVLACIPCFKELAPAGRVVHHTRSSHAGCDHEATPKQRAACRAARLRGELYVQDGFDGDNPVTYQLITAKGSKRTHHLLGDDVTCGITRPKTGTVTETDDAADITCPACLERLDDAA